MNVINFDSGHILGVFLRKSVYYRLKSLWDVISVREAVVWRERTGTETRRRRAENLRRVVRNRAKRDLRRSSSCKRLKIGYYLVTSDPDPDPGLSDRYNDSALIREREEIRIHGGPRRKVAGDWLRLTVSGFTGTRKAKTPMIFQGLAARKINGAISCKSV